MKVLLGMLRWLCLAAAAAFALAAPLAALPLPGRLNPLLLLFGTLFLGEWGHLLAAGPVLIAIAAFLLRRGHPRVTGAALLLCLAGAGLFLTPMAEAWVLSRGLPARLQAAFGPGAAADRPFSLLRLCARAPEAARPERLRYGEQRLPLDFYRAQGRSPAPCVVVLHGGGWSLGSRRECQPFDAWLARRGYAVAAIEYTLAPGQPVPTAFGAAADFVRPTAENRALPHAPWPAPRDDVRAAVQYLRRGADALGIDPNRIVLLGRSAGGQLAEAAGFSRDDPGIRGLVGIYGPTDLPQLIAPLSGRFAAVNRFFLLQLFGKRLNEAPGAYREASPIALVRRGAPPTLLIHGGRDPLVPPAQAEELDGRLEALGVPHALVLLPWAGHGCDFDLRTPSGQLTAYAVEQFLGAVTR